MLGAALARCSGSAAALCLGSLHRESALGGGSLTCFRVWLNPSLLLHVHYMRTTIIVSEHARYHCKLAQDHPFASPSSPSSPSSAAQPSPLNHHGLPLLL